MYDRIAQGLGATGALGIFSAALAGASPLAYVCLGLGCALALPTALFTLLAICKQQGGYTAPLNEPASVPLRMRQDRKPMAASLP